MQIIIDTREQNPLEFGTVDGVSVVKETLKVGDYGARYADRSIDVVVIERKSVADLFHSFTHAYANEKEKIRRAKDLELKYILAIESPAIEVRKGHSYWKGGYLRSVGKSGVAQVRQIMTLLRRGDFEEVWWCRDRKDMAFRVMEYFLAGKRLREKKHAEEKKSRVRVSKKGAE